MNIIARLTLILFMSFIAMPTIVAMVEKGCDTSIFFTMTEEEESHKDLKVVFENPHGHPGFDPVQQSRKIIYENLSRHDNVAAVIFSPPPEQA